MESLVLVCNDILTSSKEWNMQNELKKKRVEMKLFRIHFNALFSPPIASQLLNTKAEFGSVKCIFMTQNTLAGA